MNLNTNKIVDIKVDFKTLSNNSLNMLDIGNNLLDFGNNNDMEILEKIKKLKNIKELIVEGNKNIDNRIFKAFIS